MSALDSLNARLSASPVITATVRYPVESGLGGERTGRLVLAKALLWSELPYEVLSYAAKNAVFPHDSTNNQWFDEGQFSQYKRLGHLLGERAAVAHSTGAG